MNPWPSPAGKGARHPESSSKQHTNQLAKHLLQLRPDCRAISDDVAVEVQGGHESVVGLLRCCVRFKIRFTRAIDRFEEQWDSNIVEDQ